MKKTLFALAAAATIGITAIAAPTDAFAQRRGGAFAAGIIGGLAAGAIIGGAIAANPAYPAYAPAAGWVAYPAYAGGVPVGCPGGYWARRPLVDPYGNVVGWSRPRFFCPSAY